MLFETVYLTYYGLNVLFRRLTHVIVHQWTFSDSIICKHTHAVGLHHCYFMTVFWVSVSSVDTKSLTITKKLST